MACCAGPSKHQIWPNILTEYFAEYSAPLTEYSVMTEYFTFHIWSPVESNIYDECQLYSIYSSFGCPLETKQKSSHPECDITCSGPHHCKIFSQTVSPTKTDEATSGKSNFFAHIVGNVKNSKLSYQSFIPVAGLNVQNRLSTPKKIFGRPWLNILWQYIRSWKTIGIARSQPLKIKYTITATCHCQVYVTHKHPIEFSTTDFRRRELQFETTGSSFVVSIAHQHQQSQPGTHRLPVAIPNISSYTNLVISPVHSHHHSQSQQQTQH